MLAKAQRREAVKLLSYSAVIQKLQTPQTSQLIPQT